MIADYEDLQESEDSEIHLKRFRCQEENVKREYKFPCANGTIRLPHCPRPSLLTEGNLEPKDDVEIEEDDKKWRITEDSWSMSGELFIYRHHKEPRLKFYDVNIKLLVIPLKYVWRNATNSDEYKKCLSTYDHWYMNWYEEYLNTSGQMEDLRKSKRQPVQTAYDLNLGWYFHDKKGKKKNDCRICKKKKNMPNCKQHVATEESTRYWPMTKITSRILLTLVWNWKKDTAPAMSCIEKNDSRGPQTIVTSIDTSGEQSDSENTRTCGKSEATFFGPHRWKKICGKFSPCQFLFQKLWRYQKSKSQIMEHNKDNSNVGCQESKTKVWSDPLGEKRWKKSSLREFDGPLSLEERRTHKTPPVNQGTSCAQGETSKTKKDTKQYSQSKVLQRLKWQRQTSWTPSQSFMMWLEKQVTQVQGTLKDDQIYYGQLTLWRGKFLWPVRGLGCRVLARVQPLLLAVTRYTSMTRSHSSFATKASSRARPFNAQQSGRWPGGAEGSRPPQLVNTPVAQRCAVRHHQPLLHNLWVKSVLLACEVLDFAALHRRMLRCHHQAQLRTASLLRWTWFKGGGCDGARSSWRRAALCWGAFSMGFAWGATAIDFQHIHALIIKKDVWVTSGPTQPPAQNEDRTPRRTHIFLSVAHLITDRHTHLRAAQVWDVLHLCAS